MWDVWPNLALLIVAVIVVAVAVEAITEIVTSSELFAWLKMPLVKLALPEDPARLRWYWTYLHKLLSCGYCFSVIAAFGLAWSVPGGWFGLLPWDNLLVKWMLLHRCANWWHIRYVLLQRGRIVPQDILLRLIMERKREQPSSEVNDGTDRPGTGTAGDAARPGSVPAAADPYVG